MNTEYPEFMKSLNLPVEYQDWLLKSVTYSLCHIYIELRSEKYYTDNDEHWEKVFNKICWVKIIKNPEEHNSVDKAENLNKYDYLIDSEDLEYQQEVTYDMDKYKYQFLYGIAYSYTFCNTF